MTDDLLRIDPDAPGLIQILKGKKGPAWQWFTAVGCLILLFLNVLELLIVFR